MYLMMTQFGIVKRKMGRFCAFGIMVQNNDLFLDQPRYKETELCLTFNGHDCCLAFRTIKVKFQRVLDGLNHGGR